MSNENNRPKDMDEFMELLNRVGISKIFVVDDARTVTHEEIMEMAAEAEKEENESS